MKSRKQRSLLKRSKNRLHFWRWYNNALKIIMANMDIPQDIIHFDENSKSYSAEAARQWDEQFKIKNSTLYKSN